MRRYWMAGGLVVAALTLAACQQEAPAPEATADPEVISEPPPDDAIPEEEPYGDEAAPPAGEGQIESPPMPDDPQAVSTTPPVDSGG